MTKSQKSKTPFNKPFIVGKELFYISKAVLDGKLSGDGKFTKLCHEWLVNNLGCFKSLLVHSCTAALEMAAILCDIKPGDEIIMPSFTFVSTANAVVLRGGVPVFVDIRQDTLNIDEKLIEKAITPKTRAIVAVHYAGVSCDMDTIMDIASRHKLYVVEDAAQALLSKYKDRYLGSIGHLGCLSFHETKNIISGEGGALLLNDETLFERAEIIREKGTNRSRFFRGEVDKYTWVDIGSSYLPSELIGAFLFAQLEMAEEIISERMHIYQQYMKLLRLLEEKGYILLPYEDENSTPNGHMLYFFTRSNNERHDLIDYLKSKDIDAVFHYIPLHSSPAGIKFSRTSGDMKFTNDLSSKLIRLPLFYGMKDHEINNVVDKIYTFYKVK